MKIDNIYYDFRKLIDMKLTLLYNIAQSNVSFIKRVKLSNQPITFFNKCKMFFDESSLPPSCVDVVDLSNKFVLYGLFCNGKFYIGKTKDFGERMSTHMKDSKSNSSTQQLYKDMIKKGECISFVFCIAENEKECDSLEHFIINECKNYSIEKSCDFNKTSIQFINESIADKKEYGLNYCYNIKD